MSRIESLQLQRLVDGELDLPSIQALLARAESHPELWREIAAAFVEDQQWKCSFGDSDLHSASKLNRRPTDKPAEAVERVQNKKSLSPSWWAMAAAVMIASVVGYLSAGVSNNAVAPTPDNFVAATNNNSPITNAVYEPDYRMQLDDGADGSLSGSEIPLYDFDRAERLGLQLQPREIPEDLRQQVQNSGYGLEQRVRYISGRMKNGQRVVVPVRQIRLTPRQ